MARKPTPQPLSISSNALNNESGNDSGPKSGLSLRSPGTPRSPFRFSSKPSQSFGDLQSVRAAEQQQFQQDSRELSAPSLDSLSISQQSAGPNQQDGQRWEPPPASPPRTGFFANYKASKSSNRLQPSEAKRPTTGETMSRGTDNPALSGAVSSSDVRTNNSNTDKVTTRRPVALPSRSDPSLNSYINPEGTESIPTTGGATSILPSNSSTNLHTSTSNSSNLAGNGAGNVANNTSRRSKPKSFNLLGRTKSIRNDRDGHSPSESITISVNEPDQQVINGIKTAPLRPENDRTFREIIMNSRERNRSADRQVSTSRDGRDPREFQRGINHSTVAPQQNSGHAFLHNLKSGGNKAVSLGRGFFGKVARSGSTTEREPVVDDEHYVLKVINLPLIEQTRHTRISKQLEQSRDKTEFWMPAFAWRAIDFLNYRGTETEGLYRVPGSGPQIKKWQRRFDEELDVNLFEQEDLYDINIIGSMFKAWLRELPDEILPKSVQDNVPRDCEKVPQELIDGLSKLPPYNYYLLFAITCHLSLLLEHSQKNKMDFRNLCICFQPCLKIDMNCFKYLVVLWRDCWKGCKTEKDWLDAENEYREEMGRIARGESQGRRSTAVESSHDERNVSSSDSNPSSFGQGPRERDNQRPGPRNMSFTSSIDNRSYQSDRDGEGVGNGSGSGNGNGNGSRERERERDRERGERDRERERDSQATVVQQVVDAGHLAVTEDRRGGREPLSPIAPLSPMRL